MLSFLNKIKNLILYSNSPQYVENLLNWALHRNWMVKIIHDPFVVNIPVPKGDMPEMVKQRYEVSSVNGFSAQYLYCLPNAKAFGAGFIALQDGGFLLESAFRPQYLLESNIYKARFRRHKFILKGDYMTINSLFSGNHGHWLYDEIPRIYNALSHIPTTTKFLIHSNPQKWKLESLALIGIPKERLVEFPGYAEVECERLWFASKLGDSEQCITSPKVAQECSELYRRFAASSLRDPSKGSRRIFVSRSKLSKKRIINEEELWPFVKKYGFDIIHPETYSLNQQIEIFHNCEFIMGSFGAALTNLIFCPKGATLIDIQEDGMNCPRSWYWKLAAVHGRNYKTIVGKKHESSRGWGDSSLMVDVKKFDSILSCIFADQSECASSWFTAV